MIEVSAAEAVSRNTLAMCVDREAFTHERARAEKAEAEHDAALAREKVLRKALEWYGKSSHWCTPPYGSHVCTVLCVRWLGGGGDDIGHGWERARALLTTAAEPEED